MSIALWVLLTLATFRLAQLVSVDKITEPIRLAIGRKTTDNEGYKEGHNRGWKFLADLINCPYCTGVWIAFIAAFGMLPSSLWFFIIYWLSIAGGQSFLEGVVRERQL